MNPKMLEPPPIPPAVAALPQLTRWDSERLRQQLGQSEPLAVTQALAMCLQPEVSLSPVLSSLLDAARRALAWIPESGEALPAQLAAAALGRLEPSAAHREVELVLSAMLACSCVTTQTYAAHSLWRLQRLPKEAHEPLVNLLLAESPAARKTAALCVSLQPEALADALVRVVTSTPAERWTLELLDCLARSAGKEAVKRRAVESFLLKTAQDAPLVPTGIGLAAALVRLALGPESLRVLVTLAGRDEEAVALAALEALQQLGELASPVRAELARLLAQAQDPAREEALARVLVGLKPEARELPLERLFERVRTGPDRSAAAHCLLMSAQPQAFARAAPLLRERFDRASEALKPVLSATHERLAGQALQPAGSA